MSAAGWGYPKGYEMRQGAGNRSAGDTRDSEEAAPSAPPRASHGELAYSAAQALAYAREMRRLCRDGSPGHHCAEALAERAMAELRATSAMHARAAALFTETQP